MKGRIRLRFRNRVTIFSIEKDGGRRLVQRSNIVTIQGKQRAAELLGGLSASFLTRCQLGDGGTDGIALNTPIAPAENNVALVNVLQDLEITTKSIVPTNVLRLTTNFFTASPNANPFLTVNEVASEAGLLFQDGVLFARTTFPSIPFNPPSRTGLTVVWEIEIV